MTSANVVANVINLFPEAPTPAGDVVSQLGDHTLTRLADNHYVLTGPTPQYPVAWLLASLPDGVEWFTDWAPGAAFRMNITPA